MNIVFVAGTGTEVGKTWTLVQLVRELRGRGRRLSVRKPAQSFEPAELGATDAELLAAASGEQPQSVCPAHRWYETPMAPCLAATQLGRPAFTTRELAVEVTDRATDAVRFVEGAGGPRSPLAADGDNVDLARALGGRVVILVADAGLGTINAVRLATGALSGFEVLVFLNRFDSHDVVHRSNRDWLSAAGYPVLVSILELADRLDGTIFSRKSPVDN